MKTTGALKHIFTALLVLGIAVGCASPAPKEDDTQAEAVMAAQKAIADAKAANAAAKAAGAEWRDTDALIKKAEEALRAGDTAGAIRMANLAKRQAENALAQKKAEDARLAAAMAEKAAQPDSYTVVSGDSLWSISARGDIYDNPYQWPLIYKANREQIKDADLIYPDQTFSIERGASGGDIDAAIHHAKTRGAWSVGEVEQSDLDYLAR